MDLDDRFARRVDEQAVAEVLHLIAAIPNKRESPSFGDVQGEFDFWFDGGACRVGTGYLDYQFTNGAHAGVADSTPALHMVITFANGCRVRVQQESWGPDGQTT